MTVALTFFQPGIQGQVFLKTHTKKETVKKRVQQQGEPGHALNLGGRVLSATIRQHNNFKAFVLLQGVRQKQTGQRVLHTRVQLWEDLSERQQCMRVWPVHACGSVVCESA